MPAEKARTIKGCDKMEIMLSTSLHVRYNICSATKYKKADLQIKKRSRRTRTLLPATLQAVS